MITFEKSEINLKTSYEIAYIQDRKNWEIVCSNKHPAPWELYETKVFDNMDDAITFYMIQFFNEDGCYDVKMFEEIKLDDEIIRESSIEPQRTFAYTMRKIISKSAAAEVDKLQKTVESLEYEVETYRKFIKKYNAEKLFGEFTADSVSQRRTG